jgi:hypothetical protein
MAITITGTVVIDESTGTQNAADTSDSSGNDIAGGAGVLPSEFDAALVAIGASSATATGVAVSGGNADNSTGTAMITGLPAGLTDVSFTDSAGATLDGDDSGLTTTDGTKVFLYTYSGDNNVLFGVKGDDNGTPDDPSDDLPIPPSTTATIVFAAYLDTQTVAAGDEGATSAKVWMVQFESMFNLVAGASAAAHDDPVSPDDVIYVAVSSLQTFSLEGAPSGQNLFLMYGDPGDATDDAIVVTATDAATGGTVNTGQAGGGTTIGNFNQMLDAGEGLTFTFVTGANSDFTVPNLTQTEADSEGNILFGGVKNATAASFKVVQTQPASKAGTLTFEAFTTDAEPGAGFIAGYTDDDHVNILTVVVKNAAGTVIETNGDTDPDNLTISLVGGVATIVGVKAGYTIEYTTAGNHQRVQIDNSSPTGKGPNGADFDIGDFQLITALVEPTLFEALEFQDDGPAVDFGNLVGTGTETAQVGYWSMDPGADGLGDDELDILLVAAVMVRADSSTDPVTSIVFDELAGSPDIDGSYLFAGTLTGDFDDDTNTADTDRDFTLTAFDDGHYELVMEQAFGSVVIIDTADGALGAGGPDPVQTLTIPAPPATPITDVVFFSVNNDASDADILSGIGLGATDPTEDDLEGPPLASFIDPRSMNVSTAGIGVDNNLLQGDDDAAIGGTDESFVINPEILASSVEIFIDNSVQGYSHTDGERLYYKAFFEDGTNSGNILVTDDLGLTNKGQEASFVVDGGGQLIDAVQLTMASGDVKIPNIVFVQETEVLASDIKLDFTATVTDGDGDTATDSFSADLYANKLSGSFDFVLTGTATEQDAFNVDLSSDKDTYQVTAGFEVGSDLLVLIGDATATVQSIATGGADTVVTIAETGGVNTTTVTVVGVDLTNADIVFG